MAQDPYKELGVSRTASADEIRKAFRKLAKQLHPDQNPGDKAAEERFKRVSGAFDIIGDVEKRKKFDRGEIDADGRETMRGFGGGDPFGGRAQGGFSGGGPFGGGFGGQFEGADLNDILGEMFGRAAGGRAGGFSPPPAKGGDVRAKLDIDLEEAIQGGKKRIAFSDGRTLDVTIPKGATEGQVMRLKGQGSPGRGGPGDALIELNIRPHPIYRREGEALVMDLPISVPDAVLGAKVEAPTPDGPVSLTVPKGSNSGQMLRLKGRGLPASQGGPRGDLLARLVVVLPEAPDEALEKFAEKWRKERPYAPRRK
ncbi:DnaJ C-terminal domain-containing protein [Phenylobacterium montanum]|uniref:J domain-containing protein n=1 Tax=Phenylobacterium montanum TaxID=2823693 RepID=A0A975FVE8_9CAUL|nr:J domain-containing protein [Caulobacter sp. S6]QUD86105.1 J domain-containing protein [Caulobacter sp. S6]